MRFGVMTVRRRMLILAQCGHRQTEICASGCLHAFSHQRMTSAFRHVSITATQTQTYAIGSDCAHLHVSRNHRSGLQSFVIANNSRRPTKETTATSVITKKVLHCKCERSKPFLKLGFGCKHIIQMYGSSAPANTSAAGIRTNALLTRRKVVLWAQEHKRAMEAHTSEWHGQTREASV